MVMSSKLFLIAPIGSRKTDIVNSIVIEGFPDSEHYYLALARAQ